MVLVICYLSVVVPWAGVHPWGSLGKRPLAPTPPIFNDGARGRARRDRPGRAGSPRETERCRKLPPHTVHNVRESYLRRTCRPRFAPAEHSRPAGAQQIALTISAACASTGWTVNGAVSN